MMITVHFNLKPKPMNPKDHVKIINENINELDVNLIEVKDEIIVFPMLE